MPSSNEPHETAYKIHVTTGKQALSANVFLQIFGKRRNDNIEQRKSMHDLWSVKFPLKHSAGKFRAGRTDFFETLETDVGKLRKLRVSHDGLASWHLKKIVIEMPSLNRTWKFKCNQLIGRENTF